MKRCNNINKSLVYIGAITLSAAIGGLVIWLYKRKSSKRIIIKNHLSETDKSNECFINNLNKYITFSPSDDKDVSGVSYKYNGDKNYEVRLFTEQTGVRALLIEKGNIKKELPVDFGNVGINDEEDELNFMYNDNEYLIGQYDFDNDGTDELIIAIRTRNKITNGICINIFRPVDETQWILTSETTILGEAEASFEENKIKIPRHLHGYSFIWEYSEKEDDFNLIENGFGEQVS